MNKEPRAARIGLSLASAGILLAGLSGEVPAQQYRGWKECLVAVPAGEHTLGTLVDLVAQVSKKKIDRVELEFRDFAEREVTVQREMMLGVEAFEDFVSTLLFYEGFVIVAAEQTGERRVLALRNPDELQEAAVARTPEQIFARPARMEFVTTTLPSDGRDWTNRINAVRPFVSGGMQPWGVRLEEERGGVRLTGTSDCVAFALAVLRLSEGGPPPSTPEVEWQRSDVLPWPGGKMPCEEFFAMFADTLDANVLGVHVIAHGKKVGLEFDLGEPAQLAAAEWFARATYVLQRANQGLAAVAGLNRVFILRHAHGPGFRDLALRARIAAPDQVGESAANVYVLTTYEVVHVTPTAANNAFRARSRKPARLPVCIGTTGGSRMLVTGLRDEVVKALAILREADRPGPTTRSQ